MTNPTIRLLSADPNWKFGIARRYHEIPGRLTAIDESPEGDRYYYVTWDDGHESVHSADELKLA